MSANKRYYSPLENQGTKRMQQPYFVDKRLTPRVKEYLDSYEMDGQADAEEVVDYLQITFQEYSRKKRNSLRQSVTKVLNSLTPDKKTKLQTPKQDVSLTKNRFSYGKKSSAEEFEDQSDSQSMDDDEEELIEAKDTNMINNSMHMMYKKANNDSQFKSQVNTPSNFSGDEKQRENQVNGIPLIDSTTPRSASSLGKQTFDKAENAFLLLKATDLSTPVPSPAGSKGGKSDTERSASGKLKRKRKDEAEKKQESSEKKGIKPSESNLKLSDIGGYEDALEEVMKLLFHLKHPEVFLKLGVKPPRGFLLHGPPGCGKTLLANAIAGELKLPYYKLAATEIVSGVSGESEEKLRDLFITAQASAPSIVFLDEIDAVAPNRESASKDMERRIVSQLLVCMDDLDRADCDVLLIGATNRPDSLDPALRRAGRFDREICLGIPDKAARQRILEIVCCGLRLSADFNFCDVASLTPGYVGADLISLTREAAMFAVKRIFENLELSTKTQLLGTDARNEDGNHDTEMKDDPCTSKESPIGSPWLSDRTTLTPDQLEKFFIEPADFKQALVTVQPSAKREGFATVPDVTWDDIGALEDIREELTLAILAPVRHSEAFASLGIANPPGILLAGPPGCGKTLLAKAIANEAGINFISVKGPELLNMYVGESERAVRQVFQRARNSAPCVIFFDEIDALCPKRSGGAESSASSRVVNQLLTEMDGLVVRKQVFLMGATNRPDIIDPAILRPGRLDKILFVGLPAAEDRIKILQTITKFGTQPKFGNDIGPEDMACDPRCERFSGADLAALVREASVQTLKEFMKVGGDLQSSRFLELRKQHFEKAFNKLRPSVSLEDQKWYDKLHLKFGLQKS